MASVHVVNLFALNFAFNSAGFASDESDWYEYVEVPVRTFAQRIKAAIDGDTQIQADYAPPVVIILDGDETRYDVNAKLKRTLIAVHSLEPGQVDRNVAAGRHDLPLSATITIYVRSSKGMASNEEVALLGDGTAAAPGLAEVYEDLRALLADNRLASAGQPYLRFGMEVGPMDTGESDDEDAGDIVKGDIVVTGHKWLNLW